VVIETPQEVQDCHFCCFEQYPAPMSEKLFALISRHQSGPKHKESESNSSRGEGSS
jgi:hypothetical protein